MVDLLDGLTGDIVEDTVIAARGSWSRRIEHGGQQLRDLGLKLMLVLTSNHFNPPYFSFLP